MQPTKQILKRVQKELERAGASALDSIRVTERHLELIQPEVLSYEEAELHDLNQLVAEVVRDATPLAEDRGVRISLIQDMRLPSVAMLVEPIREALAVAIEICLATEHLKTLKVRTLARGNRAVAIVDRVTDDASQHACWRDAGPMGRVDLMVGESTSRALGGRMRILHRGDDLRAWLELPMAERTHHGTLADDFERNVNKPSTYSYQLSGSVSVSKGG
ncbi:MAG: hypothetical protein V1754_14865 [Pseudomonadota bacterium]